MEDNVLIWERGPMDDDRFEAFMDGDSVKAVMSEPPTGFYRKGGSPWNEDKRWFRLPKGHSTKAYRPIKRKK